MACMHIIQLNCGRDREIMPEAGQGLLADRISIAFLQESYAVQSRVCGMASAMRIYAYSGEEAPKAAVVIADDTLEVMEIPELVTTTGAIVEPLGKLIVCSLYCRFGEDIGHDLAHLRRVIKCA